MLQQPYHSRPCAWAAELLRNVGLRPGRRAQPSGTIAGRALPAACVAALVAAGCLAGPVREARPQALISGPPAQDTTLVMPLYLPPTRGATALSSLISAQAQYRAAQGFLVQSAAIARKINAEAVEQELENCLRAVEVYFETRLKNRQYRAQLNPGFLQREERRQRMMRDKVTKYYQFALKGDETRMLNWLLNELSGPLLAVQCADRNRWLMKEIDFPLARGDIQHIRLTDRGSSGGKNLVFRASDARVLNTVWPRVLLSPEFDDARHSFELARDMLLEKLAALAPGQSLDYEVGQEVLQAVDKLLVTLENVYPKKRRRDPQTFIEYNTAKRYIRSLLAGVCRALETNDRRLFDGSYRFEGATVVDLLGHLYQSGLEFAPPEPGDEGTYEKLFVAMREIYLRLVDERALPGLD
ncbi:MAG TPA: hypothetical protein EYH34_17910 [Planctomycetes bacterium]|nr:hypothetical protein [Planctomycetota bacterium]